MIRVRIIVISEQMIVKRVRITVIRVRIIVGRVRIIVIREQMIGKGVRKSWEAHRRSQ